jgi:hypothetical protein
MDHTTAVSYKEFSSETLKVNDGEVAYIVGSFAEERTDATYNYTNFNTTNQSIPIVTVVVDFNKLDQNSSYTISSSVAIPGPCEIKIGLRPAYKRETMNYSGSNENNPDWSVHGNWEFGSSHASVSFRIVGSEQAPSKKFATVIPENASTNIRVILEQSTDLINWTTSAPGVFPPSTAKRFFRVRSEEE